MNNEKFERFLLSLPDPVSKLCSDIVLGTIDNATWETALAAQSKGYDVAYPIVSMIANVTEPELIADIADEIIILEIESMYRRFQDESGDECS